MYKLPELAKVDSKQLLDEVLVISGLITVVLANHVEVRVISRRRRRRLITITETLIILDITKTSSNNCFVIHWTKKKWKSCFSFFSDGRQSKACELAMIIRDLECPLHDYCITKSAWLSETRLVDFKLDFRLSLVSGPPSPAREERRLLSRSVVKVNLCCDCTVSKSF